MSELRENSEKKNQENQDQQLDPTLTQEKTSESQEQSDTILKKEKPSDEVVDKTASAEIEAAKEENLVPAPPVLGEQEKEFVEAKDLPASSEFQKPMLPSEKAHYQKIFESQRDANLKLRKQLAELQKTKVEEKGDAESAQ